MAFAKKTWKDRLVEHAGRRMLKRISGDPNETMVVDVTRSEGTVSQEGDAFSGANMNDLEQRIGDAFEEVNNNLGGLQFYEDEAGNKYVVGADSVPKKLGNIEFAKLKKKTQTINSGRLGSSGYIYTFTANNLSRIDGIVAVSARGYSTPSQAQDASATVSIVNRNQIQFILPAGNSYYEYTGTVYQYIIN